MRARALLIAGIGVGLLMPGTGHAITKSKPVVITDPKGDNNALNDQGVGAPIPEMSTPIGFPGMDIISLTFESVIKNKVATALKVTLELDAAPAASAVYRITGAMGGCDTVYIMYETSPGMAPSSAIRSCDAAGALGYTDVPLDLPKLDGSKLIWEISYKFLEKGLPETKAKLGSTYSNLSAHCRTVLVAATVPVIDQVNSTLLYKLGS